MLTAARFVTNFADQGVLLPLVVAVAAALFLAGWRRAALAWSGVTGAVWTTILLLKLACLACGPLLVEGLHSPSGHTAAAATAMGGLFGLVVRWRGRTWRWTLPISAGTAAVVGLSRLALHTHSLPDVLMGGTVGVAGATLLVAWAGAPPPRVRLLRVLAPMAAVILLLYGTRLPAEGAIKRVAALGPWRVLGIDNPHWQTCRLFPAPPVLGSATPQRPAPAEPDA